MDTGQRIFELLSESGMEQKEFAHQVGILPQTVTDWKNKKSKSYTKYIPKIAEVLGTTSEYLLTGTGSVHKNAVSELDTGDDTRLMAAFFEGGEDLSDEEMQALWDDAKDYIKYKMEQRRKRDDK